MDNENDNNMIISVFLSYGVKTITIKIYDIRYRISIHVLSFQRSMGRYSR